MRILHVVPALSKNGVVTFLMEYYRHFDRDEMQFDFAYGTKNGYDPSIATEIEKLGGRCFFIESRSMKHICSSVFQIAGFLKKNRNAYEIVHVHQLGLGFFWLALSRFNGIKCRILHSHLTTQGTTWLRRGLNAVSSLIFSNFATDFWACSDLAGISLWGRRKWSRQGVYIPNTIEVGRFTFSEECRSALRSELGLDEGTTVVLHVGNLSRQKNPRFLLRVFAEVLHKRPGSVLVSCGQAVDMDGLLHLARDLGIESSIRFMGVRQDVGRFLSMADVMVFPSFYEGLPMAIVEAQAAGLPCILSDTITRMIKVSGRIEFQSLKNNAGMWAELALRRADRFKDKRYVDAQEIKRSGFDVRVESPKLQSRYRSKVK